MADSARDELVTVIREAFTPSTYWTDGAGDAMADAILANPEVVLTALGMERVTRIREYDDEDRIIVGRSTYWKKAK